MGELGGRLSGGERQRIAIARAILKDAPIVLLDERSAALDSESELALQQAIDRLVAGHTVIAHRLSTVLAADQILVMQRGRIVGRGTHRELVAFGGAYGALWARQQESGRWKLAKEAGAGGQANERLPVENTGFLRPSNAKQLRQ